MSKRRDGADTSKAVAAATAMFLLGVVAGALSFWLVSVLAAAGSSNAEDNGTGDWRAVTRLREQVATLKPWSPQVSFRGPRGRAVSRWQFQFTGWGVIGTPRSRRLYQANLRRLGTVQFHAADETPARDRAASDPGDPTAANGRSRAEVTSRSTQEPSAADVNREYTRREMVQVPDRRQGEQQGESQSTQGQAKPMRSPPATSGRRDRQGNLFDFEKSRSVKAVTHLAKQLRQAFPQGMVTRKQSVGRGAIAYVSVPAGMVTLIATPEAADRVAVAYTSVLLARPFHGEGDQSPPTRDAASR
jgi:hypothetical protein